MRGYGMDGIDRWGRGAADMGEERARRKSESTPKAITWSGAGATPDRGVTQRFDSIEELWRARPAHRKVHSHRLVGPVSMSLVDYEQGFDFGPRAYAWDSIELILRGSGREHVNGRVRPIEPGAVLTYPPGSVRETPEAPPVTRVFQVRLPAREATPTIGDGAMIEPVMLETVSVVYRLYRMREAAGPQSEEMLRALCDRLAMLRCATIGPSDARPLWCDEVIEILREQSVTPPDLASIAHTVGVSKAHLCRAFRRWQDCTIGDFIRSIRLLRAIPALARSDQRAYEIAYEAGFVDHSHFIRSFVACFGVTPGEFRRDYRGEPDMG